MGDMRGVITPKSDQLNSDDLLAGPLTIKVTGVSIRSGQEQPVAISYEGDNGKPYKACKSMCRVMVSAWGPDSSKYVGRSMTLYCDPKVKWAGMEVGGIRISHMSDIPEAMTLALTVTKGSRKPYIIQPLIVKAAPKGQGASTGTTPELTRRERVIKFVGDNASSFTPQQLADLKTALKHAGSTDALLDQVEEDAKVFIEVNEAAKGVAS